MHSFFSSAQSYTFSLYKKINTLFKQKQKKPDENPAILVRWYDIISIGS